MLLKICSLIWMLLCHSIPRLCLSNYPFYGLENGFKSYRDTVQDFMPQVDAAMHALSKYADQKTRDRLKIIVAEYGPFDWKSWPLENTMGYNMANFEIIGEQLKRPSIEFSCFWNTRWIENDSVKHSVFDALNKNGEFNANGMGMMLWGNYMQSKMIQATSTAHLRVFATSSTDKKKLTVFFLNKSDNDIIVDAEIANHKINNRRQIGEMTSTGPDDVNPLWIQKQSLPVAGGRLKVKGNCIEVITYTLN